MARVYLASTVALSVSPKRNLDVRPYSPLGRANTITFPSLPSTARGFDPIGAIYLAKDGLEVI